MAGCKAGCLDAGWLMVDPGWFYFIRLLAALASRLFRLLEQACEVAFTLLWGNVLSSAFSDKLLQ